MAACYVQTPQIDLTTTEEYSDRQAARQVFCELTCAAVYQPTAAAAAAVAATSARRQAVVSAASTCLSARAAVP